LLLTGVVLFSSIGQIQAAPMAEHGAYRSLESRPPESIAYARIAVVRVLVYYNGMLNNDPSPIPFLDPCAADGVLVGTTGNNLNSFDYVLTPTAAVNPIKPCAGVLAAFEQLNGAASSWSIGHINVLLNAGYTGTGSTQLGTILYTIYPAQVTSNAGPSAVPLLALPLTAPPGAPTHDLPVLSSPQPSDLPADPSAARIVDLTNVYGQPLNHDSETFEEVKSDLYPISIPASQVNQAPQPTATTPATVTPPQMTVTGGTAQATVTSPPIVVGTPLPLSAQISLGAPEIDSNGRLVSMVIADAHGNHVLTSLDAVNKAIGPVTSKPGPLMEGWHRGLARYYATPPQFSQAAGAFQSLISTYPDFGGAGPFLTASQQQSTTIPSLTQGLGGTSVSSPPPPSVTGLGGITSIVLFGVVAFALLLIIVTLLYSARRRSAVQRASMLMSPDGMFEDEVDLDLLPPGMPLEDLEKYRPHIDTEAATAPLATVNPSRPVVDKESTAKLPALPAQPSRTRQRTSLMPHPAGVTHPGVRRAAEPNQDNIFAVQGIRVVNGRTQPFGLFIVADGMGGHLNGQEASRLAIELIATSVLQALNSNQPIDNATVMSLLPDSVQRASAHLRERNVDQRLDMGTTITAALVVDDMAYVVNVGDSRTYIMSPDVGLRQITIDHSVVASLASAGVIRPEEIYTHPRRNQIYRSLGGDQDEVDVDTFEVPLQAGDKLLLCSDGLWEMVRDPQIEYILRGTADPQQAVALLVREANTNGGEDNISAIVVRMLEDVPEHAHQGLRVVVAPQESDAAPSQS
jgi:serine/threonine protein phosphatase PrpC